MKHYNLDVILAVGYRVRSPSGTEFRRWATERLREYLVKGFTMDDERLKNPPVEGSGVPDYFDELLERIRDIRASERRMYLRVKEIFALAADYDPAQKGTVEFFKIIQNKLHFPATDQTAAELIARRADHALPNMGLTTWKGDVGPQARRDRRQELPERRRNPRAEPHRDDVARLRRGSGTAPQAGLPEGLGDEARGVPPSSTNAPSSPTPDRSARTTPIPARKRNTSDSPPADESSSKPRGSRGLQVARRHREGAPPRKKRPPKKSDHPD